MDEFFKVDDLFNFPKEDHIFSSTTDHSDHHHQSHHHNHYHHQQSQQFNSPSNHTDIKNHHNNNNISHHNTTNPLRCNNNNSSFSYVTNCPPHFSYDFTDQLCVPNDDVAELEWLSNFVDDSTDLTTADFTRTLISQSHTSSTTSAARSKCSRQRTWKASISPVSSTTTSQIDRSTTKFQNNNNGDMMDDSSSTSGGVRRCTHCASEKTPQWRTGPMGPKTLCNACGVRYKSGRLVPEYRPAASPTFVLTQHSNSHRKVMELRRQKEVTVKQQNGCVYRHTRDYEVC